MTEDRSLSDFVNATGSEDSSDDPDGSNCSDNPDDPDRSTGGPSSDLEDEPTVPVLEADDHDAATASDPERTGTDSGLSTYAWGTYTCRSCGETVDRVWRVETDLVCSACVAW
ncbi:hypothetical protein ACLI4Y_00385 [Natrialbaceae archaeon A-CW3]